jgi:CheY-like chemotaxis protein
VLIVDDDPKILKLAEVTLEQLDYKALCVDNAERGLAAASHEEFAAVVLDLLMPEIDGFEFLERFRHPPGRPDSGHRLDQQRDHGPRAPSSAVVGAKHCPQKSRRSKRGSERVAAPSARSRADRTVCVRISVSRRARF